MTSRSTDAIYGAAPRRVSPPHITSTPFGTTPDGDSVTLYTLTNAAGVEAQIMNFGGVIVSLKVPDREDSLADVVLGFDELSPYEDESPYFGALIGRYGNRIADGKFTLNGNSVHAGPEQHGQSPARRIAGV